MSTKKNGKFFIVAVLLLCFTNACKSRYDTTELENNFSKSEIVALHKITQFYKNQICADNEADFKSCYEKIPHDSLMAQGTPYWSQIDFQKQQVLYQNLLDTTQKEIWTFCKTIDRKTQLAYASICPAYDGRYQKYLLEFGLRNPYVAHYVDQLQKSGDFNMLALNVKAIALGDHPLDLKDPNIQLIMAIHFLSLNDQEKRSELFSENKMNNTSL
ncbi:hypothetical protein SCB49_08853 [unidentified eubacterium SCB49]|nr:hypothetical protein SCB49_08853 [unidentified eubacterium SCB49]